LAKTGGEDHGGERIAALLREIGGKSDGGNIDPEHLGEHRCHPFLQRIPSLWHLLDFWRQLRHGQGAAVHLAAGVERQTLQEYNGRRNHPAGQLAPESVPDDLLGSGRHHPRHQMPPVVNQRRAHVRLPHPRHGFQVSADLVRLNPLAADFDLIIDAPEKVQNSIFVHRRLITRAVPGRDSRDRAGDEHRRRRFRPFQIAESHPRSPKPQLAGAAGWCGAACGVHDSCFQAGQRTPDRRIGTVRRDDQWGGGRHNRGFRGAVGVEYRNRVAAGSAPGTGGACARFFPADDHGPQAGGRMGAVGFQPGAPTRPVGGRQVGVRDVVGQQELLVALERPQNEVFARHQTGTGHQGAENFLQRCVKSQRRELQHMVVRAEIEHFRQRPSLH
jgi:hypothetical protein